jgi:DNA-binding transcriptional LysR family regulator
MNIHHLELFYYVARHGGISEAARNMPYGIQQPAISGQIIQLEERLGVTLFQRRPFALTDAGRKLYEFIAPFFSQLDRVEAELHGDTAQLRVGASEVVLRDHLPVLIQNVRKEYPQLKIALREGYQPQLEAWLERREIDLAITVIESKPMPGLQSLPLLELPLVLLAVKDSKVNSGSATAWTSRSSACPRRRQCASAFRRGWRGSKWTGSPAWRPARLNWWKPMWHTGSASACPWRYPGRNRPPASGNSRCKASRPLWSGCCGMGGCPPWRRHFWRKPASAPER